MCQGKGPLVENLKRDDLSSKTMSGNSELTTVDSEITKLSRKPGEKTSPFSHPGERVGVVGAHEAHGEEEGPLEAEATELGDGRRLGRKRGGSRSLPPL